MRNALAVLAVLVSAVASAELQQVEVGGSLHVRGNYYNMDSMGRESWIEQRTRLATAASFSDGVSVFIEFDYISDWGEDFRSNYLTGADMRSGARDGLRLYQAYIDVEELWGTPLRVRAGRQELSFGSEWLVGVNDIPTFYRGLSFDALRLTWADDWFSVDAVAAKLHESLGDFMEDDTDFYMLYLSYLGIESVELDGYWMMVRDEGRDYARRVTLHTLGLRGAGEVGNFDFEIEGAWQFGSVSGPMSTFPGGLGGADIDVDAFGLNVELGYTIDILWTPRLFGRFAFLDGGSSRQRRWRADKHTLPFNRLFSNTCYSEFLESSDLSNVRVYAAGVTLAPTDALSIDLLVSYLQTDKRVRGGARSLGWEAGLYGEYRYSDDLSIFAGYARFFGARGLEGNSLIENGLTLWDGHRKDDYDYLFLETELQF